MKISQYEIAYYPLSFDIDDLDKARMLCGQVCKWFICCSNFQKLCSHSRRSLGVCDAFKCCHAFQNPETEKQVVLIGWENIFWFSINQCIYDYLATKNEQFANYTRNFGHKFVYVGDYI